MDKPYKIGEQWELDSLAGITVVADQRTVSALTKRVDRLERAFVMIWPLIESANPKTMRALQKIMARDQSQP